MEVMCQQNCGLLSINVIHGKLFKTGTVNRFPLTCFIDTHFYITLGNFASIIHNLAWSQDLTAAHLVATEKLEAAAADAERKLAEEREKSERMLQAAASGQLTVSLPASAVTGMPANGGILADSVQNWLRVTLHTSFAISSSFWPSEPSLVLVVTMHITRLTVHLSGCNRGIHLNISAKFEI